MAVDKVHSRILAGGIALLASAALTAGCGSTAKRVAATRTATTRTSGTASSATAPPAQRPPSRAQALAFVHRVQLRASDLPGFAAKRESESKSKEAAFNARLNHCAGTHLPARDLAEASSPSFERKAGAVQSEFIRSFSAVAPSEKIAKRELAAIDSSRGRACLDRFLLSSLAKGVGKQGASLGTPTVSSLAPTASGVSATFGWQITIPMSVHGIIFSLHVSLRGFQIGQGELLLVAFSVPEPVSNATQQRLYSTLIERAKASRL